jgi:hypothetical protein
MEASRRIEILLNLGDMMRSDEYCFGLVGM